MLKQKRKWFSIVISVSVIAVMFGFALLQIYSCINKVNPIYQKEDFKNQWGLQNIGQTIKGKPGNIGIDINIIKAWNLTKGSPDVIVGILDTGIDDQNVEISNAIYRNDSEFVNKQDDDNNGYIDDLTGWDFYNSDHSVFDDYLHDYHGTFISSIIAASHDNGRIFGVAPGIRLLPLKFVSGSEGQISDAIEAIKYAYSKGACIINCSWDSTVFDEDLFNIIKQNSNILFICTAGKSGNNLDDVPVYPACFDLPNVISVAAIDNSGSLYALSGYGKNVDVSAPGVDILSAMPDGDYIYSSGTSYAVAYVTGVAALVKSYKPDLSAIEIANIIKASINKIDSLASKVSSGGVIDAFKCLQNADHICMDRH